MFKKPLAHQSNATPIRSSARRQFVSTILEQYPSLAGDKDKDEATDDVAPPDGAAGSGILSEKELGRLLLPEGVKSGTFETSGGVEGNMYFSNDNDPLWMTFGRGCKDLVPTLHTLAQPLPHPPLPLIQIHHPFPAPLLTGAPLFIPAVRNIHRPWLLPDLPDGSLVAFVGSETNGDEVSYVGIGRVAARGGVRGAWERRVKHLREGVDVDEGKFCDVVCIKGDHLWDMGSTPPMPVFPLPPPSRPLQQRPEQLRAEAGPSRPRSSASSVGDQLGELDITQPPPKNGNLLPLSPADISNLLSSALLQALTTLPPSAFPLPASQLYSAHILPCRPAYIPTSQRDEVVLGKSEWKKLSKWMKEVTKEGLVKSKEIKGEVTVMSIDKQHPALDGHVSFVTVAEDEAKAAKRAQREAEQGQGGAVNGVGAGSANVGKGKGKEPVIEELWKPSGPAASFWEAAGVDKAGAYPSGQMKVALDGYITRHNLVDARDHRLIVLDEELGRAVGIKRPEPGQTMQRDEVMRRLRAGISWVSSVDGVIRKGTLQPISMSVKTRQGRKTVTLVSGLETFGVDVGEFAEELKRLCAGSASVQPLQGASPKLNLSEIMVQGTQTKIITDALAARGIPRKWIKEGEGNKKNR